MAKDFIEPANERKQMSENVNLSCALSSPTDNRETIQWRKVIQRVNRLQRRIAKTVQKKQWGKAKALIYLLTKSFYAKLLAVFRVTTNKGGNTNYRLYKISTIPIVYHVKVKSKANPYLPEFDKYFFQRTKWREDIVKNCRQS